MDLRMVEMFQCIFNVGAPPKKSTFGKNRRNLSIDLAKMEVDLKNSNDQEVRNLNIFRAN